MVNAMISAKEKGQLPASSLRAEGTEKDGGIGWLCEKDIAR